MYNLTPAMREKLNSQKKEGENYLSATFCNRKSTQEVKGLGPYWR
jgi:hypothetical protein